MSNFTDDLDHEISLWQEMLKQYIDAGASDSQRTREAMLLAENKAGADGRFISLIRQARGNNEKSN